MNVFYETLSGVLEEIRSEGMEREYVILSILLRQQQWAMWRPSMWF